LFQDWFWDSYQDSESVSEFCSNALDARFRLWRICIIKFLTLSFVKDLNDVSVISINSETVDMS